MNWFVKDSAQGWMCPSCGWNLMTTNINEIYEDITEYSIYLRKVNEVNIEKIKFIARIAGISFTIARKMLMESNVCILKDKAPQIKKVIAKLDELEIEVEVIPEFKY